MSSRFNAYRVDGTTTVDVPFWNRIFRDLDTRMVGVEEKKADFEEAERTLLEIGLRRINETLLPATEKIFRVTELGFLVASSDEEATLIEGQDASLLIRAGDQRDLFTPSPFIALTRRSTTADYAIARTITYDAESGILLFNVETVVGNGGPHDDWDVAGLAGSVLAMIASLDETRSLRQAVADDKVAVGNLKADTIAEKEAAQTARSQAVTARGDAIDAKNAAEGALASFLQVYRGALSAAPSDGAQGHFYFDTSLQQARVYTAVGWAPLFSVSLGGIRQDSLVATAGQTAFSVDGGGFTFLNVFKNGVLLTPGEDYTTASPDFTLATGAAAGDQISYLAYYATEQTDFYTKEIADGRFVRHDEEQGLTPEQQAQARENISAERIPLIPTTSDASVDFNTLTTPGWHNRVVVGKQPNGYRGDNFGYLLVTGYAANRTQIVYPYRDADGPIRYRSLYAGTWGEWKSVWDSGNSDPWSFQPIGAPVPLLDNLVGVAAPPTDKGYRYIKLTASDGYNSGVLTGQSVTGSAPLVVATAVIDMSGSPINGQTVNLINTERRFLRAGNAGGAENDAMQQITGKYGASYMTSGNAVPATSGALFFDGTTNGSGTGGQTYAGGAKTISFNSANSPSARTSDETRPKNIGVTYFMRVL